MPKAKHLIKLLQVPHGKVNQEDNVREYIKQQIPEIKQDKEGNLYLINPNTPLICAHMDNVGSAEAQKHLHKIRMIHSAGVIKGTHNMGADDKVGIFIALELYKTFGNKISLLFTIQEETGGWGSESFDKSLIKDNTYCVVPDRYGTSDIIGYNNDYCTKEFEDIVAYHLNIFGFYPATGVRCDADKLQSSINCINISCGYYQHHTDQEYVDWSATKNTIAALDHLIRLGLARMEPPKAKETYSRRDDYPMGFYTGGNTSYTYEEEEFIFHTKGGQLINTLTGETINVPRGEWMLCPNFDTVEDFSEEEMQIYSGLGY